MCATPHPKCQALLAVCAADVTAHTEFVIARSGGKGNSVCANAQGSCWHSQGIHCFARSGGKNGYTFVGASLPVRKMSKAPVVREAKTLTECAPAMADDAASAEVVAMPAPVAKAPGLFHPTGVVVETLGTEMGDQGCSCEEHAGNCSKVMAKDVVVHLWKVQIQVGGREEMAIVVYWVMDGINCCHVSFLPCHMVRHAACYNAALVQVTRVFNANLICCNTAEHRMFHKNKG
jgi:hypothetical protein